MNRTDAQNKSAHTLRAALPYLAAAVIGTGLIWIVGFSQVPAFHDTFHEARHAAGLPCH